MSSHSVAQVNLKKLRPYGDIMDDGVVQLSFTLPVEATPEAREAAVQLVEKMGYEQIKVATMEKAAHGFSFFCDETGCFNLSNGVTASSTFFSRRAWAVALG